MIEALYTDEETIDMFYNALYAAHEEFDELDSNAAYYQEMAYWQEHSEPNDDPFQIDEYEELYWNEDIWDTPLELEIQNAKEHAMVAHRAFQQA